MNYAELCALGLTKYGLFTHCRPDETDLVDDGFGNLLRLSREAGRVARWFWFWKSDGEAH